MGESVDRSLIWLSSSACADSACLQVAFSGNEVLIRNNQRPDEIAKVTREEWEVFLAGVGKGDFRLTRSTGGEPD